MEISQNTKQSIEHGSGNQQATGDINNYHNPHFFPIFALVIVGLIVAYFLGGRSSVPGISSPDPTGTIPPGIMGESDGFSRFLRAETQESPAIRISYYVVASEQFLGPIFGRKNAVLIADRAAQESKESGVAFLEEKFISQLVRTDRPMVSENEPFKFARHIWQTFLSRRTISVWKINMPFASLLSHPTVNQKPEAKTLNQFVWLQADNKTLLQNGWLDLDPLLKTLATANPDCNIPFAKAGFAQWEESESGCGGDGENVKLDKFERAFIVPRKLKFLFLVITNTSNKPVEDVSLVFKEWIPKESDIWKICDESCRTERLDKQEREIKPTPHRSLKSGEHFVVSLGVLLSDYDDDSVYKPNSTIPMQFFGPMQRVDQISFLQKKKTYTLDIRPFKSSSLGMVENDYEVQGASCPYVYSEDTASSEWMFERQVLVDANSRSKARTDRIPLNRFTGKLLLSEEETETSFVDYVAVEVTDSAGKVLTLITSDTSLQKLDSNYVTLTNGQTKALAFPEWIPGYSSPTLIVSGYYLPSYLRNSNLNQNRSRSRSLTQPVRLRWQGVRVSRSD